MWSQTIGTPGPKYGFLSIVVEEKRIVNCQNPQTPADNLATQ